VCSHDSQAWAKELPFEQPNLRLKLTRLTRSFWKRQKSVPKLSPAPQHWEAGQLSRESLGCLLVTEAGVLEQLREGIEMRISRRTTGLVVILGIIWWNVVFWAMHVLEPEFSPIRAPGSAYVLGEYGAWMTTTYFAMSAAFVAAGLGLTGSLPTTRLTRVAGIAFLIASVGVVIAGLFPMDFPGPPQTVSGRLHAIGGTLTFPTWVFGALLFSLSMRRVKGWAQRSTALLSLAAGAVGLLIVTILSIFALGFGGYAQRVLLLLKSAWMITVGLHLYQGSPRSQPNTPLQPTSGAARPT